MSTSQEQVNLPGRLGDSARVMKTDPRVDPRLIAALAPFGMDGAPPETPVRLESPLQAKLDYLASTEQAMGGVFASFFNNLPAITSVEALLRTDPYFSKLDERLDRHYRRHDFEAAEFDLDRFEILLRSTIEKLAKRIGDIGD